MRVDPIGQNWGVALIIGGNVLAQGLSNYYLNGYDFLRAIRCIDFLDATLSGIPVAFGVGPIGNFFAGKFARAAAGEALAFYLKELMTPVPLRLGDECECRMSGINNALQKLIKNLVN